MSKTITISDDAYARLKRHKRSGESFTDVIVDMIPHPAETGDELLRQLGVIKPKKQEHEAKAD